MTLPDLDNEQANLPGLDDLAPIWAGSGMSAATLIVTLQAALQTLSEGALGEHRCAGQLCLVNEQSDLPEAEPTSTQLSLLPDPPPWEMTEPARGPRRRSPRTGSRTAARDGQMPLF